jgi:hypothetical protein
MGCRKTEFEGRLTLVSGEDDMRILQQLSTEHVGKSVVFFVEGKDRAIGGTCMDQLELPVLGGGYAEASIRVSGVSEHFFSPSARRNSSNLSSWLVLASMPRYLGANIRPLPLPHHLYSIRFATRPRSERGANKQTHLSGAFISASSRKSLVLFLCYYQQKLQEVPVEDSRSGVQVASSYLFGGLDFRWFGLVCSGHDGGFR